MLCFDPSSALFCRASIKILHLITHQALATFYKVKDFPRSSLVLQQMKYEDWCDQYFTLPALSILPYKEL